MDNKLGIFAVGIVMAMVLSILSSPSANAGFFEDLQKQVGEWQREDDVPLRESIVSATSESGIDYSSSQIAPAPPTSPQVFVKGEGVILFDETHGQPGWSGTISGHFSTVASDLEAAGYTVKPLTDGPITVDKLEGASVLVIPEVHGGWKAGEISAIVEWVHSGGSLLFIGDDYPSDYNQLLNEFGITLNTPGSWPASPTVSHPVTAGITSFGAPGWYCGYFTLVSPAICLGENTGGQCMLTVAEVCKVAAVPDEDWAVNTNINDLDNRKLFQNIINWLAEQVKQPTVSIYTDKYSYAPGDTMHIGLSVKNPGDAIDVGFALLVKTPSGGPYLLKSIPSVTLSAGLDYDNPDQWVFTLPEIPNGAYRWVAVLFDPATYETIDWDYAEWEVSIGEVEHWAVIIGVADYEGTAYDLEYTDDDAMDTLLSDPSWREDHIMLLIDSQADRAGILAAIDWLASNADEDDVILFFSGHGTYGPDLPPYDEADGFDEYIARRPHTTSTISAMMS